MPAKKKQQGRPPWLLKHKTAIPQIAAVLAAGGYVETACASVGMTKQTYYVSLEKGEAIAASVAGADDEDKARAALDERERVYLDFHDAVKKAEATFELRAVGTIQQASLETWQAAAWLLERKHPSRWGRQDRIEVTNKNEQIEPLAEAVAKDPNARVAYAALLRSISSTSVPDGAGSAN